MHSLANWNFSRIKICNIESNLWSNKSTIWESIWRSVGCLYDSVTAMLNLAPICILLLQILCHRFERWRIWSATLVVVRFLFVHYLRGFLRNVDNTTTLIKWIIIYFYRRLPFNWNGPIGYLVAITIQWMSLTFVCFSIMVVVSVGIAGYLFSVAVIKDIKCILQAIDENSKTKARSKQIYKQFCELIDLHSTIKQLSHVHFVCVCVLKLFINFFFVFFRALSCFSDVYQPIFIFLFLRSLLTLCCAMLVIQMELVEYNFNIISIVHFAFSIRILCSHLWPYFYS